MKASEKRMATMSEGTRVETIGEGNDNGFICCGIQMEGVAIE